MRKEQPISVAFQTKDNGVVGLSYCLREEGGVSANRIRSIANVNLNEDDDEEDVFADNDTVKKVMQHDLHSNMFRDGNVGSFRHFPVHGGKSTCAHSA